MGAGGSVVGFSGPAFTESIFRITVSLMNRMHVVNTPDFPPAPYIENIGVRPDISVDYMTRANLLSAARRSCRRSPRRSRTWCIHLRTRLICPCHAGHGI